VKPHVTLHTLGQTLDGRDLDLLQLGTPAPGKPNLWVLARQHPGESMAEWFAEGLLHRMTDPHDPVARQLLESACLWVVPNMNPDGSSRGHLRTNAAGFNLNRGWANPTLEECPEVAYVRSKLMDVGAAPSPADRPLLAAARLPAPALTCWPAAAAAALAAAAAAAAATNSRCCAGAGCDLLLDVHGDEELPYNFFIKSQGIPSWNERLALLSVRPPHPRPPHRQSTPPAFCQASTLHVGVQLAHYIPES
jgi:hypothetical protein